MQRRHFLLAVTAGALGVGGALSACSTTHAVPQDPGDACDMFEHQGGWWRAVRSSERRWGTPPALQLAIVRQESGFRYRARPPRGRFLWIFPGAHITTAHGYSQALNQTWEEYKHARGDNGVDRTEFSDATDFVAWYASVTHRQLGVPYTDARGHYLAYHEGRGGYSRGTYQGNATIVAAADRVQGYYTTYSGQLDRCQGNLNHWWWPF